MQQINSNKSSLHFLKIPYLVFLLINLINVGRGTCTCTTALTTYISSNIAYGSCNSPCCDGYYKSLFLAVPEDGTGINRNIYKCLACDSNCLTCQGPSTFCTSCDSTLISPLYLRPGWDTCDTCGNIHTPECLTCNSTHCLTCQVGCSQDLTSATHACFTCSIANCVTCSTPTTCATCAAGKVKATSISPQICNTCANLIANCITCLDGPVCTQCSTPNYVLDLSTPDHACFLCNTISQCTSCSDGPVCDSCTAGNVRNMSHPQKICVTSSGIAHCQTYADGPTCAQCSPGYAKDLSASAQTCVLCTSAILNCQTCSNGPVCTQCNPGFVKDLSAATETCVLCTSAILNCQTCSNGPVCTQCNPGYVKDLSAGTQTCVLCTSSILNCQTCSNGPVCLTCASNYFIQFSTSNKSCVSCTISNCVTCFDGPKCSKCIRNYVPDQSNSSFSCKGCLSNQYSSSSNLCVSCPIGCGRCYLNNDGVSITCTECTYGYYLDSVLGQCIICSSKISQCQNCTNPNTCQKCISPFLTGDTLICDRCVDGYYFVEGLCSKSVGCLSQLTPSHKCLACSTTYRFVYFANNSTCGCDKGLKQKTVDHIVKCFPQCGDGILVQPDEQCDDGNLNDNDGCNSGCKVQKDFKCDKSVQPSKCSLQFNILTLKHNYVSKFQGKNRCKFSFSISPVHQSLHNYKWEQHMSLNISSMYVEAGTQSYYYDKQTKQIIFEVDYLKTLEGLGLKLSIFLSISKVSSAQYQKTLLTSVSSHFTSIISTPDTLEAQFTVVGIGQPVIYQQQTIIKVYETTTIVSLVVTIVTFLQFVVGSYVHKMIGLEMIYVLQVVYFARMMIENRDNLGMWRSINSLKYVAYAGYSNGQTVSSLSQSELQSITKSLNSQSFSLVSLYPLFILNINFSLFLPLVILLIFTVYLTRKTLKRKQYFQKRDQGSKDQFTIINRTFQWIYGNAVFPLMMVFAMVCVFNAVGQMIVQGNGRDITVDSQELMSVLYTVNHSVQLTVLFIILIICCSEAFLSIQSHIKGSFPPQDSPPLTLEQKLTHDQNDPNRPNYKPFYVSVFLLNLLITSLLLITSVLVDSQQIKDLTIFMLMAFSIVYLVVLAVWRPYCQTIKAHNRSVVFNQFVVVMVVVVCQVMNKVDKMGSMITVALVYLVIGLAVVVIAVGVLRIFLEIKWRQQLRKDPSILKFNNPKYNINSSQNKKPTVILEPPLQIQPYSYQHTQKKSMSNLLKINPYSFQTHLQQACQKYKMHKGNLNYNQQSMAFIKSKILQQIYKKNSPIEEFEQSLYESQRDAVVKKMKRKTLGRED